ncbi:hypothetical protein Vadar_003898 [Vaccinium darrowii]|uniref:Uncharacterized protein n=1 Tax=Vaccinium darrowii TaxID=229202 RepID=A0ACB7YSX7_9ERIC|nr:hypothetical protein Vadar_003898 [Vaccinium darrowii]
MTNDNITFIKPGHIAQEVPRIEKLRRLKLEMNDIRMKELGFQTMATSLLPSNKKRKTKNTKAAAKLMDLGDDDPDYQPAEDEDALSSHNNDEEEIASVNSRKRSKPIAPRKSPPRTEIVPSIESIVAPSPTQGSMPVPASMESMPGSESTPGSSTNTIVRASTSKRGRVRGPTRVINTERLIAGNSGKKLEVEIPREIGVPVGDHATRFASWVGVQVRVGAPLKEVKKWSDIPSAVKAPIIQATRDKFDVKDYDDAEHVVLVVNRKCQALYRNWRHKMKRRYQQLVKAGKNPYNMPYRGVKREDWAWMIDNIWTDKDKEEIAEKRRKARADLPFNHTMGSQSFAAAMSAQAKDMDGQRPNTAEFFKSSHYNGKKRMRWGQ